ncbi:junctional adhesion molecule-like isoform X2 [Narcine bancroftii]|uniref:junctional adhesion molecule-like isoform X2 n=1 Tax=Narcine bancroftii TaxID=1343680 RepID=UPI003831C19D
MKRGRRLHFLLIFLIFNDIWSISPVGISTPEYLVVKQGVDLRLDCMFDYQEHIQMHNIKLEWFYTPYNDKEENSIFFYYRNLSVVVEDSKFAQRLKWVGDIQRNNGSILITNVKCTDSGNFICDLRIPRLWNKVHKNKTLLMVWCEDSNRSRALQIPESKDAIPKNIIMYTTAGICTFFIALSIILVFIWKYSPKCQSDHCDPPRRNDPGTLENIEEKDCYFTVSSQLALQSDRENAPMEEKKMKEPKDDNEIYVTMHAFLGTKKSDNQLPNPIIQQ